MTLEEFKKHIEQPIEQPIKGNLKNISLRDMLIEYTNCLMTKSFPSFYWRDNSNKFHKVTNIDFYVRVINTFDNDVIPFDSLSDSLFMEVYENEN